MEKHEIWTEIKYVNWYLNDINLFKITRHYIEYYIMSLREGKIMCKVIPSCGATGKQT